MYYLFYGQEFFPFGGMNDYKGQFVSLKDAQDAVPQGQSGAEWAQIAAFKNGTLQVVSVLKIVTHRIALTEAEQQARSGIAYGGTVGDPNFLRYRYEFSYEWETPEL